MNEFQCLCCLYCFGGGGGGGMWVLGVFVVCGGGTSISCIMADSRIIMSERLFSCNICSESLIKSRVL